MRIVAIDQSMTCTGVAVYDDSRWAPDVTEEIITVRSIKTTPAKGDAKNPIDLLSRMNIIAGELSEDLDHADCVVVEGPSFGSQTPTAHMLGGLFYTVLNEIYEQHQITPLIVAPKTLKKLATGKGNAKKVEVVIAARDRLGFEGTDDNEADARWLLEVALQLNHMPQMAELPLAHLQALEVLR